MPVEDIASVSGIEVVGLEEGFALMLASPLPQAVNARWWQGLLSGVVHGKLRVFGLFENCVEDAVHDPRKSWTRALEARGTSESEAPRVPHSVPQCSLSLKPDRPSDYTH